MELTRFVLENDNNLDQPHGWIQWKGTKVCMDLHCTCGFMGHVDTDFFYFYECPACKKRYGVGQKVNLIELPEEFNAELDQSLCLKTDEDFQDK